MLHFAFIGATWLIGIVGAGGAMALVAAFGFLGPAAVSGIVGPILSRFLACLKCVVAVVFLLSTVASYWIGRHGEYSRGHTAAVAEIAAEDQAAIARALQKRNVWKDCRAHDGAWDQSTGECK